MNYVQKYIIKLMERLGEDKIRKSISNFEELLPYILLTGGINLNETPMETILNTTKKFMTDLDSKRREEKISKLLD